MDKTDPWMGASPDAIVYSNSGGQVEVKCPFSAKDKDITPTTVPYLEEIGSNQQLKVTHDYFFIKFKVNSCVQMQISATLMFSL